MSTKNTHIECQKTKTKKTKIALLILLLDQYEKCHHEQHELVFSAGGHFY